VSTPRADHRVWKAWDEEEAVADAEQEFRSFAQARSRSLLRTAYLITGDHHHAEDLLQATLTKVFLAWPRIREKSSAEAHARRTLVTTYDDHVLLGGEAGIDGEPIDGPLVRCTISTGACERVPIDIEFEPGARIVLGQR
jgi:Sigma-70 region 2